MDISPILNQLNDHQREAVTADLCHLRVLAGAGSGKTRVLVYRIAWLVEVEKLSPFQILAVTFTNKAAREMQHRVEEMIGLPANSMWLGTFHGLAHRILRTHWQEAGLPQSFQVIDADDQLRLIKRILKNLGLDETAWPPKQIQWFINGQKEEGRRPLGWSGSRYRQGQEADGEAPDSNLGRSAAFAYKAHNDFERMMQKVYGEYEQLCQQGGLLDFTELLLGAYELLKYHAGLRQHYQKRFRAILVDEFQDTNRLQYAWLKLLAGEDTSIMIVGDDDQSIYSWRGACVANMHDFERDFSPTKTIRLEQNYRSTEHILKAANALIDHNVNRLGKNLWTNAKAGELISVYTAFNEIDEARFVVSQIKQWTETEESLKDCAILYRSNAQSRVFEEALIQSGIPYRIYGGLRFFERAEIKDTLSYLRLVENRHDDSAFERVINLPVRGIGERTLVILREQARDYQESLWLTANRLIKELTLAARAHEALLGFIKLINELAFLCDEASSLDAQLTRVIHKAGLREHYQKEKGEKGRARLENLDELVTAAQSFESDDETITKRVAFLTHAALEAGETQAGNHENSVQLMTAHSAKGLEFRIVFLVGMEEGLFPHQMSLEEGQGIEEERRLCYVGMTRAMKKLYLCYAESRFIYGQQKMQKPSRFLQELPKDSLEEVRLRTKVSLPKSRQTELAQHEDQAIGLKIGQRVRHESFGDGVVLNIEGSGLKARVQVNFSHAGPKWLMAEYANLTAP